MWVVKAVNLADSLDGRTSALTVSDIAELLNISERQVYKLAAENGIPSFKIGGSVRFRSRRLRRMAAAEDCAGVGPLRSGAAKCRQSFLKSFVEVYLSPAIQTYSCPLSRL
jgi:excisionase family DNA binding protein